MKNFHFVVILLTLGLTGCVLSRGETSLQMNGNKTTLLNKNTQIRVGNTNGNLIGRDSCQALCKIQIKNLNKETIRKITVQISGDNLLDNVDSWGLYQTSDYNRFDPRNPGHLCQILKNTGGGDLTFDGNRIKQDTIENLWLVANVLPDAHEGDKIIASVKRVDFGSRVVNIPNTKTTTHEIVLLRSLIWKPGDEGVVSYRIPAICVLNNGDLVASIDRRKYSSQDLPNDIDVDVKISHNQGQTWSKNITVARGSRLHGYGDAAMATDGKTIYMLLAGGHGLWDKIPIQMYATESNDGGLHWEKLTDISKNILNGKYHYGGFIGSGNGIITKDGRIMFVAALRTDSIRGGNMDNVLIYSDDNGKTWQRGSIIRKNGDESKILELPNNNLIVSSRNRASGKNARTYILSTDGGKTWGIPAKWTDLMGNACDAGIHNYTYTDIHGVTHQLLLHTLPASKDRSHLKIFVSFDGGKTWPHSKLLCVGDAAYSELVVLKDGNIGIISEEHGRPYYDIWFTKISPEWLLSRDNLKSL